MSGIWEERLPVSFFINNRSKLATAMTDKSVCVVFAGQSAVMSADLSYPFFANRNFFYLSGIEQEESILVFEKDGTHTQTTIFIWENDQEKEKWTGKRLTAHESKEFTGANEVQSLAAWAGFSEQLREKYDCFFLETEMNHLWEKNFENFILSRSGITATINPLRPIMIGLREIKEDCEIEFIRKAIHLTRDAMKEFAAFIAPQKAESELLAFFNYTMEKRGCFVQAFPPIVGADKHSLCLHHTVPSGRLEDTGILQLDVGGRIGGICADISRVFPANGEFTKRQKMLYAAVRACQESVFSKIRPGITIPALNEAAKETAAIYLAEYGIIPKGEKDVSDYYWHNVSHHMGHDVHDLSNREKPIQPGMVITVEPGLYIQEWGFGMRLEDDVLVKETRCENLSSFFEREVDQISSWVCKFSCEKGVSNTN